jgi:glycosyltransferase involved in cell wall biosynthesis
LGRPLKLTIVTQSYFAPTGYGTVARNVLKRLSDYEINVLAYDVPPHLPFKVGHMTMYGAKSNKSITYLVSELEADVVMLLSPATFANAFRNNIKDINELPPVIFYLTKDSPPLHNHERQATEIADQVWVPSKYTKSLMKGIKTNVVPFGVSTNVYNVKKVSDDVDGFRFGTVADNSIRKNLWMLIYAYSKMPPEYDLPELRMFTDPTRSYHTNLPVVNLRWYANKLGIGKSIMFHQNAESRVPMPDDFMANIYNGLDLYVLPTACESFGIPLLEAMACGVPPLVTDSGSAREVCGDAAYYIPTLNQNDVKTWGELPIPDLNELIKLMKQIIGDKDYDKYSKRGVKRATQFPWTKTVSTVKALLSKYEP